MVVGRFEKLMVERQVSDLQAADERGLVWQPDLGTVAVDFCGLCRHSKGRWLGEPLVLEPWQEFWVTTLFGWMRADGTRRFRRGYLEVARKNGKSTLAAALGLYGLIADEEGGPEIYCAATKKEQAKIIFEESKRMARASPALMRAVTVHEKSRSSFATPPRVSCRCRPTTARPAATTPTWPSSTSCTSTAPPRCGT